MVRVEQAGTDVNNMGAKGLLAAAGFAAGYLVGTRRGRKDYEQLKRQAANFVNDPRVQKWLRDGQQFASDKVPVVGETVASAIGAVRDAAREASESGSTTSSQGGTTSSGPAPSSRGSTTSTGPTTAPQSGTPSTGPTTPAGGGLT